MRRHFISLSVLLACGLAAAGAPTAHSAELALIGVIGTHAAVLAIDGGEPLTIKTGQTRSGIKLVSIEHERATVEFEGKQRVLALGQHYRSAAAAAASSSNQTITLAADTRGHFTSEGSINGMPVLFLVDTGASTVALPGTEAVRLGLDYKKGRQGVSRTAGGVVPVYAVKLDRVRLGNIEVNGVDAVVIEQGLDITLLGMSFLNRIEMRQEGRTMTLIKRF